LMEMRVCDNLDRWSYCYSMVRIWLFI